MAPEAGPVLPHRGPSVEGCALGKTPDGKGRVERRSLRWGTLGLIALVLAPGAVDIPREEPDAAGARRVTANEGPVGSLEADLLSGAIDLSDPDAGACGVASWRVASKRMSGTGAQAGLPRGVPIRVHEIENGRSVTVIINRRGSIGSGRIIELSSGAFATLAPLGRGILDVCVSW